jgi:Acyl-CoA dehydrogenase, C-terminal domain
LAGLDVLPRRTDPAAQKKQQGISFLLIDMKTPGVTVRPILTIDGHHHTNEVFLDNVRVPIANRIGEENKGWDYAKFLLGNERTGIAWVGLSKARLRSACELAESATEPESPLSSDRAFRRRCLQLEIELTALEVTTLRIIDGQRRRNDGAPDPASSILKLLEMMIVMETLRRGLVLEPYLATVVLSGATIRDGARDGRAASSCSHSLRAANESWPLRTRRSARAIISHSSKREPSGGKGAGGSGAARSACCRAPAPTSLPSARAHAARRTIRGA